MCPFQSCVHDIEIGVRSQTCVFTSRPAEPVCCPRLMVYSTTSWLKHSSPKKDRAQPELQPRPSPGVRDRRVRSVTAASFSSTSSEQSGPPGPKWAGGNTTSEGHSSLTRAGRSPTSMTPVSQRSLLVPLPANSTQQSGGMVAAADVGRERVHHVEGERKKKKKQSEWFGKRKKKIQGRHCGYLFGLERLHNASTVWQGCLKAREKKTQASCPYFFAICISGYLAWAWAWACVCT